MDRRKRISIVLAVCSIVFVGLLSSGFLGFGEFASESARPSNVPGEGLASGGQAMDATGEARNASSSDPSTGFSVDENGRAVDPETGGVIVDSDTGKEVTVPKGTLLPDDGGSPYIPIAGYETKEDGVEYYRGRVVVKFEAGVEEERMRAIVKDVGCRWGSGKTYSKGYTLVTIGVEVGHEDEIVKLLGGYPEVSSVWRESKSDITFQEEHGTADNDVGDDEDLILVADDWQQYHLYAARFQESWTRVKCNGAVTVARGTCNGYNE